MYCKINLKDNLDKLKIVVVYPEHLYSVHDVLLFYTEGAQLPGNQSEEASHHLDTKIQMCVSPHSAWAWTGAGKVQ